MKIPNLKIPVTIDASGLEGDLRKAEMRMKKSAERVAKIRSAATPALGALGGGALGGIAGGLGQFGLAGGAVGLGAIAAAAPFLIANRVIDAFAAATKGSTEALEQFQRTGVNATGINSVMLETLAKLEKRAQEAASGPTLTQSFLAGAGTDANVIVQSMEGIKNFSKEFAAFMGALTSGKSYQQAQTVSQLATANEAEAQRLRERIEMERRAAEIGFTPEGNMTSNMNPIWAVQQLLRYFS